MARTQNPAARAAAAAARRANTAAAKAAANAAAPTPAPAAPKKARAPKAPAAAANTPRPSRWVVGGTCPNNHPLTEQTLYLMPSGRTQCRSCRKSYASNQPKGKTEQG